MKMSKFDEPGYELETMADYWRRKHHKIASISNSESLDISSRSVAHTSLNSS